MPVYRGNFFVTDSPFDAVLLSECIATALASWREHGNPTPPNPRVFELFDELQPVTRSAAAAKPGETVPLASARGGVIIDVVTASRVLGKTPQMVRRDCAAGVLEATKDRKGQWRITASSVDMLKARNDEVA